MSRWGYIIRRKRAEAKKRERQICGYDQCSEKIYSNDSNIIYCAYHQCKIPQCQTVALIYNHCFSHRVGAKYKCTVCSTKLGRHPFLDLLVGDSIFIKSAYPCFIGCQIACPRCYALILDVTRASLYYMKRTNVFILHK